MAFRDFKSAIVQAVAPELVSSGFALNSASDRFVRRPSKGVAHFYHLLINESQPFARLDIHLAVRLDIVETIFHRTSGFEKRFQPGTPTMGGALDAIARNPDFKMLLDEEHGPQRARSLLVTPTMLQFYEDWFSRFSKIENIDTELNEDPFRESPNRPTPWLRCSTGIIVAWMLKRPDYGRLATIYREMLRSFSDGFYLPRFETLLNDLSKENEASASGGKS